MKKLYLFFFLATAFVIFAYPKTAEASNFAGVKVVVKNPSGNNFNGVKVGLRADTNDTYSGGGSTRSCDSDTGTSGPFVNLNGTDKYYARLYWFYTGNEYTYGSQTYNNPDGQVYFGNGVNSTQNGGGMGFGFACSCNPLKIIIGVPSGYYFDVDGDGKLDNGDTIGPADVTVSKSGLSNDSSYTYTFYLGDVPSLTRTVSMPATAAIDTDVAVTQSFRHNDDGDPIATAYIRNNFDSNGISSTKSGTSTNPYSIGDIASSITTNISTDYYASSISADLYHSPRGYQWYFETASGGHAITRGTWSEKISFKIKNDTALANKVVSTKIGAGIYPSGTLWDYSNAPKLTITVPAIPTLSCTAEPGGGPVPFVTTVTPVNPDGLTPPFNYNMGVSGTTEDDALSRSGSFSYTYNSAAEYLITITHPGTGTTGTCTPSVTVSDPSKADGGEVAP